MDTKQNLHKELPKHTRVTGTLYTFQVGSRVYKNRAIKIDGKFYWLYDKSDWDHKPCYEAGPNLKKLDSLIYEHQRFTFFRMNDGKVVSFK